MTRRVVPILAVASLLAALHVLPPAAASAAPGDLVLTKSAPVPGAARPVAGAFEGGPGVAAAAALPRPANFRSLLERRANAFPHEIAAPGWQPSRAIGSPLRNRKTDLFEQMRRRAEAKSLDGADASVIRSVPGQDTIRVAILRVDFLHDSGGSASSGDCLLYTSPSPRDGLLSRMPSSA